MNNILLDLDDCLIQSFYVPTNEELEEFRDWYGKYFENCSFVCGEFEVERYITFLRPIAYELIGKCEKLVGKENLYILTTSVLEYANKINLLLNLGFQSDKIYGREDMPFEAEKLRTNNSILVDNEDYYYHSFGNVNKVKFLNLKLENLIQIEPFSDFKNPDKYLDEEKELNRVVEEIGKRLVAV